MEEKSMTALMSAYARIYHSKYNYKIFDDYLAKKLLTKEEQQTIEKNLSKGIKYLNPVLNGSSEEALRWIIDNQISPIMLARSSFAEEKLKNDIKLGCKNYLIVASGYDTYAYRDPKIKVYEIDKKEMIIDKINRVERAKLNHKNVEYVTCDLAKDNLLHLLELSNYNKNEKSFVSLLGITYYLTKSEFSKLLNDFQFLIKGSTIVFDYPTKENSIVMEKNSELADASGETMKSKYSYMDMERLLFQNNFLIYEHLTKEDIMKNYFYNYNIFNPDHKICAPNGVEYIMAVKQ